MYQQNSGTLDVENTNAAGRQIAEWKFRSAFDPRITPEKQGPVYVIKVSMHVSAKGIVFRARSERLGPTPLENSDIEQLRQQVEQALQAQHDAEMNLVWEDWLQVQVSGAARNLDSGECNGQLVITYRRIKRGVDAATGKAYAINGNNIAVPFPQPQQYRGAQTQEERMFGEGEQEVSYVPATPENLAALDGLIARLGELRVELARLLSQEKVALSLADIRTKFPALPLSS